MALDPFAISHEFMRRKAERDAREAPSAKQEIVQRVKAAEARREALAKPTPRYIPNFHMSKP